MLMSGCGTKLTPDRDSVAITSRQPASTPSTTSATSPSGSPQASTTSASVPLISDALAALNPAQLPETDKAVSELMARMPAQVAGHKRTFGPRNEVDYADGSRFEAQKLSDAAPGLTVAQFFAGFKRSGQFTVIRQGSDHGPVLWFVANGAPPFHQYVAAFAATKGTWMYGLDAASADAATQLIDAATRNTR
jgi:hypothetical protein